MKVNVRVEGGEELCNILEFYLVRFPNAVVNKRTYFSTCSGSKNRMDMCYVFSIFGSSGDWVASGIWI